jgi:hypothetical protein
VTYKERAFAERAQSLTPKPIDNPKYKMQKSSVENSMNTNSMVQTLGYNTVVNTRPVSIGGDYDMDKASSGGFGRRKSDADINNHSRIFRKS